MRAARCRSWMYYCPKCDRTIPKEKIEERDLELKRKFGVSQLSNLRCPVCDSDFIDLEKCKGGEAKNVGKTRPQAGSD